MQTSERNTVFSKATFFIKPKPNSVIPIKFKGTKRIKRIRLGLTQLPEHKFKHSFQVYLYFHCFCKNDIEISTIRL